MKEDKEHVVSHWISWMLATIAYFVVFQPSTINDIVGMAHEAVQTFTWYTPFWWLLYSTMILCGIGVFSLIPVIVSVFFEKWLFKGTDKRQIIAAIASVIIFSAMLLITLGGI